jgi:hypothetical protein
MLEGRESEAGSAGVIVASPRTKVLVGAAIALVICTYVGVGLTSTDVYPFSSFPMYSKAKLYPVTVRNNEVYGYTRAGTRVHLNDRTMRKTVRAYVRNHWLAKPDRRQELGEMLVAHANQAKLSRDPIVGVVVVRQALRLRRYPHPALKPRVLREWSVVDNVPADVRARATRIPPPPDQTPGGGAT